MPKDENSSESLLLVKKVSTEIAPSGTSIEKFYHFICKTDFDTFELLGELQLSDKLIWKNTSMGYFIDGKLYKWGDPFSLLFFEKFSLNKLFSTTKSNSCDLNFG